MKTKLQSILKKSWYQKTALIIFMILIIVPSLHAQTVSGPWDLGNVTGSTGWTNWGSGVITLTDTTTGAGTCQGSAVLETSSTYSPVNSGAAFSQCYRAFFGCPGNDQIAPNSTTYTDQNGDGMAFSFYKNGTTYNVNNGLACGGGLGYMGAVGGVGAAGTMITIEFDTYSSVGGSGFDANYGGGLVSPSINDEISIHVNGDGSDAGILPVAGASVNAGNLEDGLAHDICITYTPGVNDGVLKVTIDGVTKISISLGATYNLQSYFGSGTALNQSWSAGKYGATNFQTIGPAGANLVGTMGHGFCNFSLPVRMLSFNGKLVNETTVLNWTTVTELNTDKFIIERSSSNSNWTEIGEVAASGNAIYINNYDFTDYNTPSGIVYYRLRQVDLNGTYSYSEVVVIESAGKTVSITPNQFDDAFTISSNCKDDMDIVITDVLGRQLYHDNRKIDNGALRIQPDLPSGAYFITVQTEDFVEQQKIIKK